MTGLKWLTPFQIYQHYLDQLELEDGTSLSDLIEERRDDLAFENATYAKSGAKAEDRSAYELYSKPLENFLSTAEAQVKNLMMKRAADGDWFAAVRRAPDAEEEFFPSRHWPFAELDLDKRTVECGGIIFRAVRGLLRRQIPTDHPIRDEIRKAERQPQATPGSAATIAQLLNPSAPLTPAEQIHTETPDGPPDESLAGDIHDHSGKTKLSLVIVEFWRRKERGQTARTKGEEAKKLAQWFKDTFPNEKKPLKAKTIMNWLCSKDGRIAWALTPKGA